MRLGFGADDKVKIERTVRQAQRGLGRPDRDHVEDRRALPSRPAVRNGHDFPIRIAIEDQLPVSENEDIVVEMLPSTTPPTATNLRDKRGVLEWAFEAEARRGPRHRLRLARALAEGQGRRDDAGWADAATHSACCCGSPHSPSPVPYGRGRGEGCLRETQDGSDCETARRSTLPAETGEGREAAASLRLQEIGRPRAARTRCRRPCWDRGSRRTAGCCRCRR